MVVILTRERDYEKTPDGSLPLIRRAFRKYPRFVEAMETRAQRYNQCRRELFELEQQGRVLVIAPESTAGFSRTERDLEKIRALWQSGYFAGRSALPAVREFWFGQNP